MKRSADRLRCTIRTTRERGWELGAEEWSLQRHFAPRVSRVRRNGRRGAQVRAAAATGKPPLIGPARTRIAVGAGHASGPHGGEPSGGTRAGGDRVVGLRAGDGDG